MKHIAVLLFVIIPFTIFSQKNPIISSPDGKIRIEVSIQDRISYTVFHENDQLLAASYISMRLSDGSGMGIKPRLRNAKTVSVDQIIDAPFYKRKKVHDYFNELQLTFQGDYQILFRAYNDGVAYRFVSSRKKDFIVTSEEASFNFDSDYEVYVPYVNKEKGTSIEDQLWNSFENTYTHAALTKVDPQRLAFLPILAELKNGKKICITEADLESYPGMYLINKDGKQSLTGFFAAYPKRTEKGGHNQLQDIVKEREEYIAKVRGTRKFPWRVVAIANEDRLLADNDLVYKLATPSRIKDVAWIKPGKVAWDWWNDWNITGVDFVAGVNTATYKFYIDFASENNLEYVILDEGWAVNLKADLMQVVPEIDLQEIIRYASSKNVGIILWAGYNAFIRDMEGISRHYAQMGVKGFKIDFMDRDDQPMVDFYYEAAEIAARHKLLLDFHGAYKPTGLHRTWPNVINFEGVHGLEQMKWSPPTVDQVTYDVTIPFIRMLAGPLDYTQGATRNATKANYRPVFSEPMSQGTRCRQLAQYVIFEAPLTMLCDHPVNYRKEPEMTKLIAGVPTVWDNTVSLAGKVGEYIVIARQSGNEWYVGGMTNWEQRMIDIEFSFLKNGNYKMEIFRDGVNANRNAHDYIRETITVQGGQKLPVTLAPGGGFIGRIYQAEE